MEELLSGKSCDIINPALAPQASYSANLIRKQGGDVEDQTG